MRGRLWNGGGNPVPFRVPPAFGGFIPAFARCCFCIAASLLVLTSPMVSPLALRCLLGLLRHTLTSHGGAWGNRGSPRRWTSNRTRCTCCRQGRAGESDPGHMRIRARSSTNRTIRSASRRHGARESGLNRTRIRARSSSNRNVCILSPCQFSFRKALYQTDTHRAMPPSRATSHRVRLRTIEPCC